jgi:hypothetical protein
MEAASVPDFKVAPGIMNAMTQVNRIPLEKFPLLLGKIIEKLHVKVTILSVLCDPTTQGIKRENF